jgi:hypothetical protein
MSGRVHDLITAENFAKWAEEQRTVRNSAGRHTASCVVAQFLKATGFPEAECGWTCWFPVPDSDPVNAPWMHRVTVAYDNGLRSGPALAKIARENA